MKRDPKYYNIANPPLLMQGFLKQLTNDLTPILEDSKDFVAEVNRGVVNYVDFQGFSTPGQVSTAPSENVYNGTRLTILAGGKEIIRDEPVERFNYVFDIGGELEQKIPVIINGGQTVTSTLRLFTPGDNVPANQGWFGQLLLHYSTKNHAEWLKANKNKFGFGLGLKRQSFRHLSSVGAPAVGTTLQGTVPKNQGDVIGFSILHLGPEPFAQEIDFAIDGLKLVKDVCSARFSKLNQRDPFMFWIGLNPGSTFELTTKQNTGGVSFSQTLTFVTFYFAN